MTVSVLLAEILDLTLSPIFFVYMYVWSFFVAVSEKNKKTLKFFLWMEHNQHISLNLFFL